MTSLLCVHAHPDDEALFTGGILAKAHAEGLRTGVVTCTYAEGHRRVDELRASLEILGAGEPRLLGYDDSGRDGEDTLCAANFDQAVGRLVAHIREFRPGIVITYDAFGGYGHPDHIRTHRITLAAVEASGYEQLYPEAGPVWWPNALAQVTYPRAAIEGIWPKDSHPAPGIPGEEVEVAVNVRPWLERKWDALCAHKSETERGAGAARFIPLPDDVRDQLLGTEYFRYTDLAPGIPRTSLWG